MLHAAGALVEQGDLDQARRLLGNAEQASGADEKVAELWARLERVERTRGAAMSSPSIGIVDARPLRNWRWAVLTAAQATAAASFGVLLAAVVASPVVGEWMTGTAGPSTAGEISASRPLTVLSHEDVALVRARQLYARGRLAEALVALDRIDTSNGNRDTVDQLRVEIQRWLLMPRRAVTSAPEPGAGGAP
jgi:hypothetical protein